MSTALEHARPVGIPGRLGQGTAVEQSRAIAEVQAQVIVAQQFPRSLSAAVRAMEEACAQRDLAGRALFRYPRGKNDDGTPNILSGPSVHLARELARCWGNVQYGLVELLRDDTHGQSELMAWAWDMEANTRSSTTFIAPHKRDTRWGVKDLTDMRDIYESNANNGSRRMREMIFAVLPGWYTARALELCAETNEKGGGKPLPQRIADAVKAFEKHRVSGARIAAKWGYGSVDELTATDVAQLGIIYESLRQGTVTVDEEFPAEPGTAPTAAELTAQADAAPARPRSARKAKEAADRPTGAAPATASAAASGSAAPASAETAPAAAASSGQVGAIQGHMKRLGYDGDEAREKRLAITATLARVASLGSTKELTAEQAAHVLRQLGDVTDQEALHFLLEDIAYAESQDAAGEVPGE